MEATWKIDIQNSGACYSTAKEISKIQPDFTTFISDYLVSDPKDLSSSELYSFISVKFTGLTHLKDRLCWVMLKLFSATFKQISAQQVETNSLKNSIVQHKAQLQQECEKRAHLEQILSSKPENSLQKLKISESDPDSSSFYMNIALAITSAIKIQSQ